MLKKFKRLFIFSCLALVFGFVLTSCEMPNINGGGTGGGSTVEITEGMLEALPFEDQTVVYDGEPHGIFIDNIYEEQGVTINYVNNSNTKPGQYTISAAIRYNGKMIIKEAKLTIEKGVSVLEAEAEQTINLVDKEFEINYSVDNDTDQKLVILNEEGKEIQIGDISKPGEYKIEIYVKENSYYNESNHVLITLNVVESAFDIAFTSKKVVADGSVQSIEIEGTLPEGYTVEYANNSGSEDGKYFATATIKDQSGEVVETHNAVLTIDNPENEEFKQYLDEFFVWYLEGDQLSVNIFCENAADFGLEHYEASWYTFEPFTEEEIAHDLQLFKDLLAELEGFANDPLSDLQETAYETLRKYFEHYVEYYSLEDGFLMELTYIDQFGGYVADFGTYMESYSLRSELEVQDIVDYLVSTEQAFPSYLGFLQMKSEAGYPLSDYTINEMKGYLEDVIAQGADYYLKDIIHEKIDGVDFLTSEQKESYKEQVSKAIAEQFVTGVTSLYGGLDEYLGLLPEGKEGYLASYESGKEMYMMKLRRGLGFEDLTAEAYVAEIEEALKSTIRQVISAQQSIVNEYQITTYAELEEILASTTIYPGSPDEMMVYLKEFAKSIVPELKSNPEIVIKQMDAAAAKVSNAVAYYMKSALDSTAAEYITLNPINVKTSTSNEVLGTLAHEGYPGHLYAYVYSKELGLSNLSTIMTNVGHAEGWATYVQLALYEYAKKNSTDERFKMVMDYLYANQLSGFLLECRIDAGIHLEGWDVDKVANYMYNAGYSADGAQGIYDLLIEMPSQYSSYGYGKLVFVNLHNEAKKVLGIHYDEVEFNAMLLSKGWTDLQILQETYEEYMIDRCHELGIQYK